jgi:beta-N-acetylhexosaminidase
VAIFSPEHGYRGVLDQGDVGHTVDPATGKTIYSLYAQGRVQGPTADMLRGIDIMLIDLQDIGGRPYTYITTVLRTLESARANDVAVLLLDRPNPIGGRMVQGPLLDTATSSDVGMLPIPMRHGMTLGELARFGEDRLVIGADLTVIPTAGWARDVWFDETGLPWVRPSPSMPDLESATHYPGTVMFEATNLSVGRGTPIAFQVVGAPWLDAGRVVARMGEHAGVTIRDTVVTPEAPPDRKFDGVPIAAVKLHVTDRRTYDPVQTAVSLLAAVREIHPESLTVNRRRRAQLVGTEALWAAVEAGEPWQEIVRSWEGPLARFRTERAVYLLYPE